MKGIYLFFTKEKRKKSGRKKKVHRSYTVGLPQTSLPSIKSWCITSNVGVKRSAWLLEETVHTTLKA